MQTAAGFVLLYGRTIWTLINYMEKNLDEKYERMLRTVSNKSRKSTAKKQATTQLLTSHLTNLQVREREHVWHSWKSKEELLCDSFFWTSISNALVSTDKQALTYISSERTLDGVRRTWLERLMNWDV